MAFITFAFAAWLDIARIYFYARRFYLWFCPSSLNDVLDWSYFFWFESWYMPTRGIRAIVLFAAGICSLLPVIFPGHVLSARAIDDPWFRSHFIVANIAYGLLSLAALHAILMHWQDRHLHRPTHDKANSFFAKWGQRLPPLMTMEHILFRIIKVGFALLTLTVFSGLFFSQTLFGRALFGITKLFWDLVLGHVCRFISCSLEKWITRFNSHSLGSRIIWSSLIGLRG